MSPELKAVAYLATPGVCAEVLHQEKQERCTSVTHGMPWVRICSMITPESFSNTVQSELHENEGASAASAPETCLVPATVICWNKDTPQAVKCILAKCWDNNTSLQLGSSVRPFWENHKVLLRFHEKIKKLKKTTLGRKKSFLVLNWS